MGGCSCFGGGGGSCRETCQRRWLLGRKAKAPWLVQQTTTVNFTYLYMLFLLKFNLGFSHLISIKWYELCI